MRFLKGKKNIILASLLLFAILHCSILFGREQSTGVVDEATHRAHVIAGILHYVQWNEHNNSIQPDTISLCTFGNPISEQALIALEGATIHEKHLTVHRQPGDPNKTNCEVVVLGEKNKADFEDFTFYPLIVCDGCDQQSINYAIRLIRKVAQKGIGIEVRTGFEIDLAYVRKAGVNLGSELLVHAAVVEGMEP